MRKSHVNGRTKCLNDFTKYYKDGRLPIRYTHVRIFHEPMDKYYIEDKH